MSDISFLMLEKRGYMKKLTNEDVYLKNVSTVKQHKQRLYFLTLFVI